MINEFEKKLINLLFTTLIQGMGVPILLDVIRIVQPSHIIQFSYTLQENTNRNLPALTEDFLTNTPGWAFVVDDEKIYSDNQRSVKFKKKTWFFVIGNNDVLVCWLSIKYLC